MQEYKQHFFLEQSTNKGIIPQREDKRENYIFQDLFCRNIKESYTITVI